MGLRKADPARDRREGEPDYAGPEFALFFAGFGLGLTGGGVRRAEDEGTGEGLPLSAGDLSVHSLNESLALKSGNGDRVFETYWTTLRGVEAMDYSYGLLDLTVYGRQETWEDSPAGWPQSPVMSHLRTNGRPTAQWSRLEAGRTDDLGTTSP